MEDWSVELHFRSPGPGRITKGAKLVPFADFFEAMKAPTPEQAAEELGIND